MKKHIFILYSDLGLGGVQKKITDIIHSWKIVNKQKNILHIVIRCKTQFAFEKQFPNKDSITHLSPFQGKIFYCLFITYLFIRYQPISILTFFQQSLIYTLIGKFLSFSKNTTIILSQDNILSMENKYPYIKKPYPKWLIHILYSFPQHIIVQTKYAKKDLIETYGIKKEKIIIISNWFINSIPARKYKPFDCIYCGRFAKQKRLEKFIQILTEVKKTLPKINALLIGDGKEKNTIYQCIKKNNLEKNITILPSIHNVIQYIAKSKLFILTSDFEGHPMALLEAMAVQTVPVVLEYPGVHEYIDDGVTGYIEKNIIDMKNRIIFLLKYNRKRSIIGIHAQEKIKRKYNKTLLNKTISYLWK